MTIDSQEKQIRDYLMSGKSLTPLEALTLFGCFRLSARIYDLIRNDVPIESKMIELNGKRVAQYSIIKP